MCILSLLLLFVCYPSKQNETTDSPLFEALETIGQDSKPDNVMFDV